DQPPPPLFAAVPYHEAFSEVTAAKLRGGDPKAAKIVQQIVEKLWLDIEASLKRAPTIGERGSLLQIYKREAQRNVEQQFGLPAGEFALFTTHPDEPEPKK